MQPTLTVFSFLSGRTFSCSSSFHVQVYFEIIWTPKLFDKVKATCQTFKHYNKEYWMLMLQTSIMKPVFIHFDHTFTENLFKDIDLNERRCTTHRIDAAKCIFLLMLHFRPLVLITFSLTVKCFHSVPFFEHSSFRSFLPHFFSAGLWELPDLQAW